MKGSTSLTCIVCWSEIKVLVCSQRQRSGSHNSVVAIILCQKLRPACFTGHCLHIHPLSLQQSPVCSMWQSLLSLHLHSHTDSGLLSHFFSSHWLIYVAGWSQKLGVGAVWSPCDTAIFINPSVWKWNAQHNAKEQPSIIQRNTDSNLCNWAVYLANFVSGDDSQLHLQE